VLERAAGCGHDALGHLGSPPLSTAFSIIFAVTAALALVALGWAHHWFWRRRFAPRDRPDEIHHVRTADGWTIALRRYRARGEGAFREPVILCHGLGANHFNLDWDPPVGLAQFLAAKGRDCWVISLRGHDGSDRPSRANGLRWGFSFDDFARYDVPAAIEHVLARTGASRAQWVGHSMGGILAYTLGGTPLEPAISGGIVAVASPSSFADQPYLRRLARLGKIIAGRKRIPQRWITQMIAPFTGHFDPPFSELVIAPQSMDPKIVRRLQAWAFEDISAGVIAQFDDWVHNDALRSLDEQTDYRDAMAACTTPILLVGGSKDRMVPPACLEVAFRRLGSADKTLVVFGKDRGDAADYGHGDLLMGRAASGEVFPRIASWLEERATRIP